MVVFTSKSSFPAEFAEAVLEPKSYNPKFNVTPDVVVVCMTPADALTGNALATPSVIVPLDKIVDPV